MISVSVGSVIPSSKTLLAKADVPLRCMPTTMTWRWLSAPCRDPVALTSLFGTLPRRSPAAVSSVDAPLPRGAMPRWPPETPHTTGSYGAHDVQPRPLARIGQCTRPGMVRRAAPAVPTTRRSLLAPSRWHALPGGPRSAARTLLGAGPDGACSHGRNSMLVPRVVAEADTDPLEVLANHIGQSNRIGQHAAVAHNKGCEVPEQRLDAPEQGLRRPEDSGRWSAHTDLREPVPAPSEGCRRLATRTGRPRPNSTLIPRPEDCRSKRSREK